MKYKIKKNDDIQNRLRNHLWIRLRNHLWNGLRGRSFDQLGLDRQLWVRLREQLGFRLENRLNNYEV